MEFVLRFKLFLAFRVVPDSFSELGTSRCSRGLREY
jgi:hypothetical protein